jgi:hypothetical protein
MIMDTFALKKSLSRLQVKETAIILTAAVILPFIVHLFPSSDGIPWGERLLPMFYAPFIAVVLLRPHAGIMTAVFSPILNSLITGLPVTGRIPIISLSLLLFIVFAQLMISRKKRFWLAAPLAYLATMSVSGIFLDPAFLNPLADSFSGIMVLLALNIYLVHLQKDQTDAPPKF